MRTFTRLARDYWADNCVAGISPFTIDQVPMEELARPCADYDAFAIGCDNAMFGVDYPHFESIFPGTAAQVADLVGHPSISPEVARKILCENAARVYGFDLERLQPDIERVGFEVESAAAAAPVDGQEGSPPSEGHSKPLELATCPSQRAEGLTVRANVSLSTETSPNVTE